MKIRVVSPESTIHLKYTYIFQLPFDEEDFSYFSTVKQQDLINEWSDSSDSGVSSKLA